MLNVVKTMYNFFRNEGSPTEATTDDDRLELSFIDPAAGRVGPGSRAV